MWRRVPSLAGRALLLGCITLAVAELVLQAGSLFVRDRQTPDQPGGARRVLCIGDSHTYGAMVPAEESYPSQLQRLLNEREPGVWTVTNLGIPGMNTSQVRARLRTALATQRPDVVVVWCGVNNAWNRRQATGESGAWAAVDRALAHLRVYRLLRVWWHDRQLARQVPADALTGGRRFEIVGDPDIHEARKSFTVRMGDEVERIEHEDTGFRADPEMQRRTEGDTRGMIEDARAAGVPIVFVAYPVEQGAFALANAAMRQVGAEYGVPVVESGRSAERLPPERRTLLWAGHPNGAIYGEVARDLLPIVLASAGGPRPTADAPVFPLARLDFGAAPGAPGAPALAGPCAATTAACRDARPCYLWNPRNATCHARAPLRAHARLARAGFRMRVTAFPSGAGGREIFGLFEGAYGTGVFVQLTETRQLRLLASGGGQASCGPLDVPLAPDVWYAVEVRAEKGERATVGLELRADDGTPLAAVTCDGQPTGGGAFTEVMVGTTNPAGTTAEARFADVEVRVATRPPG